MLVFESLRSDYVIECSYCALIASECCSYLTYNNRYTYSMISLLTSVVKSGVVAMEFTTLDCPTYAIAVQVHFKISFYFYFYSSLLSLFLSISLTLFTSIFLSIIFFLLLTYLPSLVTHSLFIAFFQFFTTIY